MRGEGVQAIARPARAPPPLGTGEECAALEEDAEAGPTPLEPGRVKKNPLSIQFNSQTDRATKQETRNQVEPKVDAFVRIRRGKTPNRANFKAFTSLHR